MIKNLDENGYIIKKKEGNNNKNVHLYPTSKGVELSLAHKMYDARNLKNTFGLLYAVLYGGGTDSLL